MSLPIPSCSQRMAMISRRIPLLLKRPLSSSSKEAPGTASAATSSSSSLNQLPPHVRRELLRHVVGNSNAQKASSSSATSLQKSRGLRLTLAGTIGFVAVTASIPVLAWFWIGNLSAKDEALTAAQVRRGAFMNSGSRDMGKDPDWDFETHRHKYEKGYGELTEERLPDKPQTKLGRLLAPVPGSGVEEASASAAAARGLPPQQS